MLEREGGRVLVDESLDSYQIVCMMVVYSCRESWRAAKRDRQRTDVVDVMGDDELGRCLWHFTVGW
jgi:hypothetical protein